MVNQANVEIISYVITLVLFIITFITGITFINKTKPYWNNDSCPRMVGIHFISGIILAISAFFFIISVFVGYSSFITAIFNPEYFALEKILNKI